MVDPEVFVKCGPEGENFWLVHVHDLVLAVVGPSRLQFLSCTGK